MIRVTVNGRAAEVPEGATLLDTARAAGVHVSTLCHHPRLPARAVCRLCLVEVAGQPHPQPACATPARDGDEVCTDSGALRTFRQADAEWLLARHPNDCQRCEANGACRLQNLVNDNQWGSRWEYIPRGPVAHPEVPVRDHTSPAIWRDLDKCIECGLCAQACGEPLQQQDVIGFAGRGPGRMPVTVFDRPLADTRCISCGQCTLFCPVGALIEAPDWHQVLHTLDARRRISVVQVAPATRIAISEEFGLAPGTVSTGRLINALRRLGFDYVFDTNFAADLTIMEEAAELLGRLRRGSVLPLLTSCCPGWVNWVELNRPDLVEHLSTTRSPQQMHGSLTKRGSFARALGEDFAAGKAEPYVVSVMPCTAKKDEALRPGMSGDIDRSITTRELAHMIRARGIHFAALPDDGRFDNPLGESTGAGQIFASSGGVMEAMARTAAHLARADGDGDQRLDWQQLRGVTGGIRSAQVPHVGRVAVCNGIAAAQQLLRDDSWRRDFVAIEVMACVGGCLGGGGEPKSMDPQVLEKRMQAVYAVDRQAPRRRSFENADVQRLYATDLREPGSADARLLLHTAYAPRHSARDLLMRFLDCVDRRDGASAARLFHVDGVWNTASAHGELRGRAAIEQFIAAALPPRAFSSALARHRMASAASPSDLDVLTPHGDLCRFTLESCAVDDPASPRKLIRRLTRTVLTPAR